MRVTIQEVDEVSNWSSHSKILVMAEDIQLLDILEKLREDSPLSKLFIHDDRTSQINRTETVEPDQRPGCGLVEKSPAPFGKRACFRRSSSIAGRHRGSEFGIRAEHRETLQSMRALEVAPFSNWSSFKTQRPENCL